MKLLIITGGSRGLGLALSRLYVAAGWQVRDISRSGCPVGEADPAMEHWAFDLADADVGAEAGWAGLEQKMAALATDAWEQVTLINNAGRVTPIGPVSGLHDAQIVQNLHINILSGIRIIACFARHFQPLPMPKQVVSLSSGAANKGYAGWSLYCAAKAGLENFMRAFAIEQAQTVHPAHPFTCITFGPGVIDTDMQADIRSSSLQDFPDLPRFLALKQAGQLRSANSVAAVLFALCTNGAMENGRRYNVDEFD